MVLKHRPHMLLIASVSVQNTLQEAFEDVFATIRRGRSGQGP
jgi:hypothetical protein